MSAISTLPASMGSHHRECEESLVNCGKTVHVFCVECGTYQCAACNSSLHETAFATVKFSTHARKSAKLFTACEARLCRPIGKATVTCLDCSGEPQLCVDCDRQRHQSNGVRASHNRVAYEVPAVVATESELEDPADVLCETIRQYSHDTQLAGSSCEVLLRDDALALPIVDLDSPRVPQATAPRLPVEAGASCATYDGGEHLHEPSGLRCIKLMDDTETLSVSSADKLSRILGCTVLTPIKVVSIVGNTGDGKSHTLNHVFFDGQEVFATSSQPQSCTIGVWAAYDKSTSTLILDTEGMLGVSKNSKQRTRMLLKVLAVSDVVIYKTDAGRVHADMFTFLSESSLAFHKHFTNELKRVIERSKVDMAVNTVAPAAIVFHETRRTDTLGDSFSGASEAQIKAGNESLMARFNELKLSPPQFSGLHYCGTRTDHGTTDFSVLKLLVQRILADSSVRSARPLGCMFSALKHLNVKFDGQLPDSLDKMFPDEYFTCRATCEACGNRCEGSMNHDADGSSHHSSSRCVHQPQLDNQVFLCRICLNNSREVVVVPKTSSSQSSLWGGLSEYAFYGYVLECDYCGVIYRSRQHWYGNKQPTEDAVRTEIRHVWPGSKVVGTGTHNAARRLLEGISSTASAVSSASAGPARMLAEWTADRIAPDYWVPNAEIKNCYSCTKDLVTEGSRHHCRACGKGFCDECSSHEIPVEWRGWHSPVRVCDACYEQDGEPCAYERSGDSSSMPSTTTRRVGEVVATAASVVAVAMEYPKAVIKEAVRPAYWVADDQIKECCVCSVVFDDMAIRHHCRSCGQGCCDPCSSGRVKVPTRGWDEEVRVCDTCKEQM